MPLSASAMRPPRREWALLASLRAGAARGLVRTDGFRADSSAEFRWRRPPRSAWPCHRPGAGQLPFLAEAFPTLLSRFAPGASKAHVQSAPRLPYTKQAPNLRFRRSRGVFQVGRQIPGGLWKDPCGRPPPSMHGNGIDLFSEPPASQTPTLLRLAGQRYGRSSPTPGSSRSRHAWADPGSGGRGHQNCDLGFGGE